jgi:triacylglycerol lipase
MFMPILEGSEGVVLLHGLCRSKASMYRMEHALTKAGFVVENVGYDSRSHAIDKTSDVVIRRALESSRLRDCTKIHFVTHSLGGVLVRSYFDRHASDRLGRVVMLAPPNRGSEVVDRIGSWRLFRVINGPAGSELGTTDSSALARLGPVTFECGVIAGDRSINWINTAMIAGNDDGKVSVERTKVKGMSEHVVVHVTHPFIMKKPEVIELTTRFLANGTFKKGRADGSICATGRPPCS